MQNVSDVVQPVAWEGLNLQTWCASSEAGKLSADGMRAL